MKFIKKNGFLVSSLIIFIILITGLIYNKFLPTWISVCIGIIGLFSIVLSKMKASMIIKIILSILLLIVSTFLFYSQYSAEKLINYQPTETSIITFVVLKNSPITTLIEAKDKMFSVSAMMDESISLFLQDQLDTKITQYKWDVVSDDLVNMQKLLGKKTDVMVLDNSMRDALIEQEPNFESETRIIYTVEKSSVKEDIVKKIKTSKQPFIILISGIDIAGPITNRSRSDVNILMVVNPVTHKILTISIPRDTYVNLGCQTGALDKLTHSGNFGINCTVKTIEKLMGIDINYYIRVNFSYVIKIINVIGDIQVYSKYAFSTIGYHFTTGMNTLNADETLAFSRERHSFASGDIQRGLNQQEVIKGMINKLVQPASLLKFDAIVNATSKSVETNLSVSDFSTLIRNQIANNKPWEITTSNLSGTGDMMPTYSMGKRLLYVMHPDPASLIKIKNDIAYIMANGQ